MGSGMPSLEGSKASSSTNSFLQICPTNFAGIGGRFGLTTRDSALCGGLSAPSKETKDISGDKLLGAAVAGGSAPCAMAAVGPAIRGTELCNKLAGGSKPAAVFVDI